MSPRAYAIMHRMHHAYTDTDKDPHSPIYFTNPYSLMKNTKRVYSGIFKKKIEPEKRFLKDLPDWQWFDRWTVTKTSKLIWVGIYISIYIIFAPSYWYFLLLPVEMLMVPVHGAIINWLAHKIGYRNFDMKNTSTNLLPVDLLLMGEAYHNDHHKHASSINFGVRWFEIDITYYIILLFGKIGIVKLPGTKGNMALDIEAESNDGFLKSAGLMNNKELVEMQ